MPVPVISPTSAVIRGKGSQLFGADQAVTWSCTGGSITAGGMFTSANLTGNYVVRATNGAAQTATVVVAITGELLFLPSFSSDGDARKRHFEMKTDSGRFHFRRKSKKIRSHRLVFQRHTRAEIEEIAAWWAHHHPEKRFWYRDPYLEDSRIFIMDSDLKWKPESYNNFEFSVVVREEQGASAVMAAGGTLPFHPSWAYDVTLTKDVLASDAMDYGRVSRELVGAKRRYELVFRERMRAELVAMELFWDQKFPGKAFTYVDPVVGARVAARFTSSLEWTPTVGGTVEYKVTVQEI